MSGDVDFNLREFDVDVFLEYGTTTTSGSARGLRAWTDTLVFGGGRLHVRREMTDAYVTGGDLLNNLPWSF